MSDSDNDNETSLKKTWERRIDICKQKHRPKLKDWKRYNFSGNNRMEEFIEDCDDRNDIKLVSNPSNIKTPSNLNSVDSIDYCNLSVQEFVSMYCQLHLSILISDSAYIYISLIVSHYLYIYMFYYYI